MPTIRLPGMLRLRVMSLLLYIDCPNALSDIPAAMLDWELRGHPNERELIRVSNEWFTR